MGVNACQSSDDETVSTNSETLVHSHAIPVEEALSSLNDFLKDDFTRANGSLPKVYKCNTGEIKRSCYTGGGDK